MKSILIFLLLFMVMYAHSQVISVDAIASNANGNSNMTANDYLIPVPGPPGVAIFDNEIGAVPNFTAGFQGNDYGTVSAVHALEYGTTPSEHYTISTTLSEAFINGDNSGLLSINWKNMITNYTTTDGYHADNTSSLNFTVTMNVSAVPPGTPVIIYYYYDVFGSGNTHHEGPGMEDGVDVFNTMAINNTDFLQGKFDFHSGNPPIQPGIPGWNEWKNKSGNFKTTAGTNFTFSVTSALFINLDLQPRPGGFGFPTDQDNATFYGTVIFTVQPLYPAPQNNTQDTSLLTLFSLDIGSDAEFSDPKMDGNEYFDPGDLYLIDTLTLLPSVTPYLDDSLIFGGDPDPINSPPFNPAPVGIGGPVDPLRPLYFDLDGSDLLAVDLQNYIYGPGNPSIAWFNDSCIYKAEYLFVSFDDDGGEGYTCASPTSVPVNSSSPVMGDIYADSSYKTEVEEYDFAAYPPAGSYLLDSTFSEYSLHRNMAPDPMTVNDQDDDVDALDMIPFSGNYTPCSVWYISVDHEAAYHHPSIPGPYLDPATIYEVTALGPVPVIDSTNDGLPSGTDIDAFEFAWVWDTSQTRYGLALLFSVDDDDTLTLEDESGGMDPSTIYYSFLDGTNGMFSAQHLRDDVDALAVWQHSLNGTIAFPNPVWGTKTWKAAVDSSWENPLNWFPQGVPFDPEDVTVSNITPLPVIAVDSLDCRQLNIENGASIDIVPGVKFTVKKP